MLNFIPGIKKKNHEEEEDEEKETIPVKDEFGDDENDAFFNDYGVKDKDGLERAQDGEGDEMPKGSRKKKKGKKGKKKQKKVQIQKEEEEEELMSDSDDDNNKKAGKGSKGTGGSSNERVIKIAVTNYSYCSNNIKNHKYTMLTFLPHNLIEQLIDPINLYVVILIALQLLPVVTVSDSLPTLLLPFIGSLLLRATKELREDNHLYNEGQEINGRKVDVMRKDKLKTTTWDQLYPGDVIIIKDGETVPADCLLLYSSNTYRECCYLDPRSLDGSQYLMKKDILKYTENISEDNPIDYCNYFVNSKITYEKENPDYNSFKGKLELVDGSLPITIENIVFRGAILKSTDFIYGVVLYTG